MSNKHYHAPEETGTMVNEPAPALATPPMNLASLRHKITDAVYESNDKALLYLCFTMLQMEKGTNKVLLERLSELASLPDGWDGEGSLSIKKDIIEFAADLLGQTEEKLLSHWVLFPDARGYVYLDYTNGNNIAGITIADNKLVAFSKINGIVKKYAYEQLSVADAIRILIDVYDQGN